MTFPRNFRAAFGFRPRALIVFDRQVEGFGVAYELPDLSGTTVFDERLREVPADRDSFEQAVAQGRELLQRARRHGDPESILRLLGYLGDACRVLGRLEEAASLLTEAVERSDASGDRRSGTANRLRLAEALKYKGDLDEAEIIFRRVLKDVQDPDLVNYRDFALQHLAKCCLEMGNAVEAVTLLEQALILRQQKNNARLIASTELALSHARVLLTSRSTE